MNKDWADYSVLTKEEDSIRKNTIRDAVREEQRILRMMNEW